MEWVSEGYDHQFTVEGDERCGGGPLKQKKARRGNESNRRRSGTGLFLLHGNGRRAAKRRLPEQADPIIVIRRRRRPGHHDAPGGPEALRKPRRVVVVDKRGGGSAVIAMDITKQAAPDGYTLLVGATTMILTSVTKRVAYDVRTAYEPVVQMTNQPYFLVVHPSVPVSTPKEFVDYARGRPGKLSYGTSGQGSLHFFGMERFSELVGIRLVHVPYKGSGPALVDLLSGQIQLMFTSTVSAYRTCAAAG